jgi:hypothetical protein
MKQKLIDTLEARRAAAGPNGRPLAYHAWGKKLGVVHTSLFRFRKGERTLGKKSLRALAKYASANGDAQLLIALAEYVLDVEMPVVDN